VSDQHTINRVDYLLRASSPKQELANFLLPHIGELFLHKALTKELLDAIEATLLRRGYEYIRQHPEFRQEVCLEENIHDDPVNFTIDFTLTLNFGDIALKVKFEL
jgi:hypothetical protein